MKDLYVGSLLSCAFIGRPSMVTEKAQLVFVAWAEVVAEQDPVMPM